MHDRLTVQIQGDGRVGILNFPIERIHTMNRKRRRIAAKIKPPLRIENMAAAVDYVLADAINQEVVIGPVLWQPDQNGNRVWYFAVASGGPERFRTDKLPVNDAALADEMRAA
jgi:hypothetical protein